MTRLEEWKNDFKGFINELSMPKDDYNGIMEYVDEVPNEERWIPVSERLPKDRDWYLGIFREPDTGWINPLPFICDYVGHETKVTTKEHWILRGFTDRYEHIDYYFNLECVAWMPLPKPYEPQKSDKDACKDCYYNDGEVHAECVICDKAESEGKNG